MSLNTAIANLIANERRRRIAEELSGKNQELEAQSQELQAQTQELHLQTEELRAQRIRVEEADRLKSEFLSNMSHELRTPLNSILALSEIMSSRGPGKDPEKDSEYIRIIERNGHRLLNLINDILDLSKIEAGRMELVLSDFAPRESVQKVFDTVAALAVEQELALHLSVDDVPTMHSDEDKVHQILLNLVSNAIKFTPEGAVSVRVTATHERISFAVRDTGIGIPESERLQIFDEFRQLDGSTTRTYEGTGLGLAICIRLARLMGGDIHVRSVEGEGSTFTLVLPKECPMGERAASIDAVALPTRPGVAAGDAPKRTALVVDDDPKACALLENFLLETVYDVVVANDGKEALKQAHAVHPFAITLDVIMPGMDGWEVLKRLKASNATADIPVIIVSIRADSDTGVALGATGCIVKPVTKEMLLEELKNLSRSKRIEKILVVDDDPVAREYLQEILTDKHYQVELVSGGEEAIELTSIRLPDAVILDLMMPGMDGFTLLDRLRKNPRTYDLPVIVVSAKDLTPEERSYLTDASQRVIAKGTMNKANLLREVEAALAELEGRSAAHTVPEKPRILVIEDNRVAALQIQNALEENGFTTAIAAGGPEGLDAVRASVPDAVVLDLMMPEIDGFEVLNEIRSTPETASLPVLILTAKELTAKEKTLLKQNNIQELIQKGSVNRAELLKRVRRLLPQPSVGTEPPSVSVAETKPEPRIEESPSASKAAGDGRTVLVVEDNPDNMFTIKELLGEMDCRVIMAEEGLKIASERDVDAAILDVQMPRIVGVEMCRRLKADTNTAHIPVVLVTAHKSSPELRARGLDAGADGFITKPIGGVELVAKIRVMLRIKKAEDDLRAMNARLEEVVEQRTRALQESEHDYGMILRTTMDGFWIVDTKGRFVDVNDAYCQLIGYSRDELLSMGIPDVEAHETPEEIAQQIKKVIELGSARFERQHRHKDGHTIDVEVSTNYLDDAGGKFIVFVRDITERKRAVEALRESEMMNRSLLEGSPVCNKIIDLDYKLVYMSGAGIVDLKIPDITSYYGQTYPPELYTESMRAPLVKGLNQAISGEISTVEAPVQDTQGGILWYHTTFTPVLGDDGRVKYVIGTSVNITDRKRAEKAQQEYHALLQTYLDVAEVMIVALDASGVITLINPEGCRILGYTYDEIIGRNWFDTCLFEKDRAAIKSVFNKLMAGELENVKHFKNSIRMKNECPRIISFHNTVLHDESAGIVGILFSGTDITDAIEAEEHKARMEVQLQESQKMDAIGTLAGGIAHDFNNILAAIIGYSELALGMDVPPESELSHHLQRIHEAGERAGELVKQILMFSRREEHCQEPLLIVPIVKEAIKMLRATFPSTIEIRLSVQCKSTEWILGDTTHLHQIVMNLCTNALHAMLERGGALDITLSVTTVESQQEAVSRGVPAGEYLKLTVGDTGQGIPPEVLSRIFEPFYTTKPKGKGTGMGLAVVHGLVKNHGGAIDIGSELGQGTTVEILLPRQRGGDAVEAPTVAAPIGGSERILLVDDEESLREVAKTYLQRLGYEVDVRSSGFEALEQFRAAPEGFDLVITDQTMPQMTGGELATEILRIRPDIPVVLCTGHSEVLSEEKAYALGIRAFMMKPVRLGDLTKTIRHLFDSA